MCHPEKLAVSPSFFLAQGRCSDCIQENSLTTRGGWAISGITHPPRLSTMRTPAGIFMLKKSPTYCKPARSPDLQIDLQIDLLISLGLVDPRLSLFALYSQSPSKRQAAVRV